MTLVMYKGYLLQEGIQKFFDENNYKSTTASPFPNFHFSEIDLRFGLKDLLLRKVLQSPILSSLFYSSALTVALPFLHSTILLHLIHDV
jgi:hypothetical protein